jgi:hypothetical protein
VFASHFPCFTVFSPYSRSSLVCVSSFMFFWFLDLSKVLEFAFLIFYVFFSISLHIQNPKVSITHFSRFPFLLPYSRSCSVCVSFSTFFCILSKFQVLQYKFLIFHEFHYFLPYSRSYSEHFSVSTFFSVSCHIPAHTLFVSHFPRFSGFVFLCFFAIIQVLQCAFHTFPSISVFLPYSSSYSVNFTFSTFYSVFHHIP